MVSEGNKWEDKIKVKEIENAMEGESVAILIK